MREYIDWMFRKLIGRAIQHTGARIASQCAVCRSWPAQPVCEACVIHFGQPQPRCETCALPVTGGVKRCGQCVTAPPPLDACVAAVTYGYPWSGLITRYKFHNSPGLASTFATLLRSTPWVEPALERAELIVPMPLSAQRLQTRGYNQAWLLAKELVSDLPATPDGASKADVSLLLRIKDTPAQSSLDRAQRLVSVRDAFAVDPLRANRLKGKRVVLIDDVMTSGASLFAAALAIRSAGAAHITGMVIARTQ
jgi:ComF family protein